MTSQINPNNIDGSYPVAGQDNNSQGFRDNFTNLKVNFQDAAAANFVVKVAGTAVPVASVALGTPASWIVVTPTTPLVKTDVVTITMQSTNIKSAAGAYFAGCANKAITNIVP